jgi:hypothetical protein
LNEYFEVGLVFFWGYAKIPMLGYASITTTERYLEPMRSLQVTTGDFIQIELALAGN